MGLRYLDDQDQYQCQACGKRFPAEYCPDCGNIATLLNFVAEADMITLVSNSLQSIRRDGMVYVPLED